MHFASNNPVSYYVPHRDEAKLWVLTGGPGPAFFAEEVYRLAAPGSGARNGVPLFRNRGPADAYAGELAARGILVRVSATPEPSSLIDLLVRFQDFGTTHVCFDPRGTVLDIATIERAIIGLYLFE